MRRFLLSLLWIVAQVAGVGVSLNAASAEKLGVEEMHKYGEPVPYEAGKTISFPNVTVTYTGDILEPGHAKITTQVFEIASGNSVKTVKFNAIKLQSLVVRFGCKFYVLDASPGYKTLTVRKGLGAALRAKFLMGE